MAINSTLVCLEFGASNQCVQQAWVESYVFSPEEQAQVELILQGGMDWEVASLFFIGTLSIFITGFGIGLILSQLRKMR